MKTVSKDRWHKKERQTNLITRPPLDGATMKRLSHLETCREKKERTFEKNVSQMLLTLDSECLYGQEC
ncbi:hypothetical protein TNCV_1626361 [Trichonephila clavipes]|nr:hypothetical protein TNCV_1626361 [Trichonephila clavipes]